VIPGTKSTAQLETSLRAADGDLPEHVVGH